MKTRLVKGAKETYGWVIVGLGGAIKIPPFAWVDYGFDSASDAIFTPGSRTSGGFGISTDHLMEATSVRLGGNRIRVLGSSQFMDGWVMAPPDIGVEPGDWLLTVRGSCYALGFAARGPIYQEATENGVLLAFEKEIVHGFDN